MEKSLILFGLHEMDGVGKKTISKLMTGGTTFRICFIMTKEIGFKPGCVKIRPPGS
ncbi:hypothetical protein N6H13_04870 [Paenibacillus sp. CC-CFT742]|nr:hypothetical protein [Paenibacillus sp. CC-CFT742]WJH30055.1 hypothetical protein N6H13_04870 [Paenibacillus sp. CC-CFT742]